MRKKILLSFIVLAFFAGCSVKEDRTGCPCTVMIDFSGLDVSGHPYVEVAAFSDGVQAHSDTVRQEKYMDSYSFTISGDAAVLDLYHGWTEDGLDGKGFVVEPGVQFPELYLQACNLDTGGERTEVEADLHKVYCKVTLYLNTEGAYPYDLMVSGGVTGYDLSGRMVYGAFEYSPEPDNGGVCSVCVPRQTDSTLRLAIREADNTLREFAIGEYILASGYDWSAEDLEDIDIEIDYAKTDVSFTVNGWETTVSLEVII